MARLDSLRLVGVPETNRVMAAEATRIAKRKRLSHLPTPKKAGTGALIYPYDSALADALVRYHRSSSRILRDLYSSREQRLEPLYDQLAAEVAADEREVWQGNETLSIRARNVGDFAASLGQLVGAVKSAVVDGLERRGVRMSVASGEPDLLLALRQHDDELTLSIDLTGHARHLRGYRKEGGVAPLRENLAAVLVLLTRWDARSEPLIDPMAGSGTIAIEAALLGRGAPVFGTSSPEEALFADTRPVILANEIHTPAVNALRDHAERAGVADDVTVHHGDALTWPPQRVLTQLRKRGAERPGVILTNPPYGVRVGDDVDPLYREFGAWCRQFSGYRVGVLCAHREFEQLFGLRARIRKPLSNGSQRATFYLFDV